MVCRLVVTSIARDHTVVVVVVLVVKHLTHSFLHSLSLHTTHTHTYIYICIYCIHYSHPGCDCPADFAGEHCEFSTAPVEAITGSGGGGGKGSTGVVIFAVVFAAVIVVVVGAMMYHRRYVHGKEMDTLDIKQTGTGSSEDGSTVVDSPKEGGAPVLDMGPEKDNEGNELQNVEII